MNSKPKNFKDTKSQFQKNSQPLSDLEIQNKEVSNETRIYDKLTPKFISFLSYTSRSEKEIVEKMNRTLLKYKISEESKVKIKNKFMKYFREIKLLDDEKYLKDYVASKQSSSKQKSPNQIKGFLLKKGFSFQVASDVISQLNSQYSDDYIQSILKKKTRQFDPSNPKKSKQKIVSFLISKGIPFQKAIGSVDTFFKVK